MTQPVAAQLAVRLPAHWRWAHLADLTAIEERAITDGPFGSNLKTQHYTDQGPRVIRLQNVGEGRFIDGEAHISEERFEMLRAHEARAGDIVLASLGETLPRACLVPGELGPAIVKADCPRLRPHPAMNAEYLMWALNSETVRAQAAAVIHGVGRPRLKLAELKRLRIPVPPPTEQDRIVAALHRLFSAVEQGCASFDEARSNVETFDAALYAAALRGELTGATEHDASTGFPRCWDVEPLERLTERITSGSRDWKPYYGRGSGVFVLTQNVRPRRLDLSDPFPVDPPDDDPARTRSAIREDDLLITIVGANVGNAARVRREFLEHYVCQSLALVRLRDRSLSPFLELFLTAPSGGQRYFESCFYGQGRPHISFADLKRMPVPVPPNDEQRIIVETFERQHEAAAELVSTVGQATAEAQRLRRSILVAATTGVLADGERGGASAEALLMRIQEERSLVRSGRKRHASAGPE